MVGTVKRSGRLKVNPEKARAWQRRSAEKAQQRQRTQARERVTRPKSSKPRRNDSGWRAAVLARVGDRCVACGRRGYVEIDHVWPRSQGGPSHVLNGIPLCSPFGCDAHGQKTRSERVIEWHWLDEEQRAWLADSGWVVWNDEGAPEGRGWKHFGHRTVRTRHLEGGAHDRRDR